MLSLRKLINCQNVSQTFSHSQLNLISFWCASNHAAMRTTVFPVTIGTLTQVNSTMNLKLGKAINIIKKHILV